MVAPTSLLAYDAFFKVFEEAMDDPKGVRLKFDTVDQAIIWRVQAHTARRYHRDFNRDIHPEPEHMLHGRSEYDDLILKLRRGEDCAYIYIVKRSNEVFETEKLSELDEGEDDSMPVERPKDRPSLENFIRNEAPIVMERTPLRRL